MLSNQALAKGLAILQAAFTRDLTPDVVAVYRVGLNDLTDAEFERAVNGCVKVCRFFPKIAELRDHAGLSSRPTVDVDKLLAAISALGSYNPNVGWLFPRVDLVRENFGQAVAAAYGLAGAARCFSDNETSRDIARRVFADEAQSTALEVPPLFLIGADSSAQKLLMPSPHTGGAKQ